MMPHRLIATLLVVLPYLASAENIQGIVCDVISRKPLSFVQIQCGQQTGITNEDGEFHISYKGDSLTSMVLSKTGYRTDSLTLLRTRDTLFLAPEALNIQLLQESLKPKRLIDSIMVHRSANYPKQHGHEKLFKRTSFLSKVNRLDYEFGKVTIDSFIEEPKLIERLISNIPDSLGRYRDDLYNYYSYDGDEKIEKIKTVSQIDSIVNLLGQFQTELFTILENRLKYNQYWKVQSGPFLSTKLTLGKLMEEEAEEDPDINLKLVESSDSNVDEFFWEKDFFQKKRKYRYSIQGKAILRGQEVFIVNFTPKRKHGLQGHMFVDTKNYAVVELSYHTPAGRKSFSLSLFGISYSIDKEEGFVRFTRNTKGYRANFLSYSNKVSYGLKRKATLVLKEQRKSSAKTKGKFHTKLDISFSQGETIQLLRVSSSPLKESDFTHLHEVGYINTERITHYSEDNSEWDGFTGIAPTQQMK